MISQEEQITEKNDSNFLLKKVEDLLLLKIEDSPEEFDIKELISLYKELNNIRIKDQANSKNDNNTIHQEYTLSLGGDLDE